MGKEQLRNFQNVNALDDEKAKQLSFQDDCGVCAVWSKNADAPRRVQQGLLDLQGRGTTSSGLIMQSLSGALISHKDLGPAQEVFADHNSFEEQQGCLAIGHDRYATHSGGGVRNAQPFLIESGDHFLAFAHNGNLNNTAEIAPQLTSCAPGDTDSALFAQTIFEAEGDTWIDKFKNASLSVNGSFSFTAMTEEGIYVGRDKRGNRPLWIGKSADGETIMVSSESYTLEQQGMFFSPVMPGEIIHVSSEGSIEIHQYAQEESIYDVNSHIARCLIEYIYLQREGSRAEIGPYRTMAEIRHDLGRLSARNDPLFDPTSEQFIFHDGKVQLEDLMVIGVPRGGLEYADGYAAELNNIIAELFPDEEHQSIESAHVLKKIKDIRSYMHGGDRLAIARAKIQVVDDMSETLAGKTLLVIDDSVIRGNMMTAAIEKLRAYNPKSIHVRSGCPVIKQGCELGIVMEQEKLLYTQCSGSIEEMARAIGADSLDYQHVENLLIAIWGTEYATQIEQYLQQIGLLNIATTEAVCGGHCVGCMKSPEYPTDFRRIYDSGNMIQLTPTP